MTGRDFIQGSDLGAVLAEIAAQTPVLQCPMVCAYRHLSSGVWHVERLNGHSIADAMNSGVRGSYLLLAVHGSKTL